MIPPPRIAPPGDRSIVFSLGAVVEFTSALADVQFTHPGPPLRLWRGWTRWPVANGRGVVVGMRTVFSGPYVGYHNDVTGEPANGERKREVSHRVVLVAFDPWKRPIRVLVDDITVIGEGVDW